ncbi:predicted protein [Naegleria gruberi]|uniref:Predicted protein n=1 Tax=Naegleria gruberi TaxID=5762 RepID=D2W0U7_NAEGR|nr:uncharacterized protein NAEGRDRAFT_74986 [Naegleria gruberi]EFC37351.1 predicted protein [Naegleria gruberi]|eukprot:XP_002670095.1 predicted protein [Naegleria gruberi strain NEG-M]
MERTIIILDDSLGSEALKERYLDERFEWKCDRCLLNSLDFSNVYYSMDEFLRLIDNLKDNRFFSEIILKAVSYVPYVVSKCSPNMMKPYYVRELISRNVSCYNFLELPYYSNDRECLLKIIANTNYCQILGQASEELQNDKAFIMEAIEWNYKCYYYLKERMRKDRDIALLVVSKEGYMLEDSDIKHCFSADKEVVKAAVMSSHSAIMFASSKLKEDREFFKNDILPFDPSLFRYAHLQLRSDITYISELIVNFPQCIQYAISNIQGDIEYVLELIKINPLVVLYANWKELSTEYAIKKITQHDLPDSVISSIYEELDDDYALDSFVMRSIQRDPKTLQLFHLHKGCLQVVSHAVQIDGLTLEYAERRIRMEKDIVRKACKQNPNSFKFADPTLRQDLEFVSELIEKVHPTIVFHASLLPKIQRDVIKKTLLNNPKLLKEVNW